LTSPFIDDVARAQILLQTGDGLEQPAPAPWPPFVQERVQARQQIAREIRFASQTGGTPAWDQLEAALIDEEAAIQAWLADPDEPNPFGRQERYRRWIQQMRLLSRGVLGKGRLPQWEARRAEFDLIAAQLWNQRELEIVMDCMYVWQMSTAW